METRATSAAAWTALVSGKLSSAAAWHGAEELAGTLASLRVTVQHHSETHVWQKQSRV